MGAFKAYDIRGIYGKDFTKEEVYKIGYFLPRLLNTTTVLVGRDDRLSSPEIFQSLCNGITDSGAAVHNLELCTTPYVYWVTAKYGYEASVMITASHNPKEYNGLKISRHDALPVGYDTGLNQLEEWIKTLAVTPVTNKETVQSVDYKSEYIEFQRGWLKDISALNMVVDCSNGMANLFVKEIYGEDIHYIFDKLDGSFPNHEPNPLEAENRVALQQAVLQQKADIGIVFDGDADRVMFVDETGTFIPPDLLIAVLADYFLGEKSLKGKVLQDIRSSKSVALEVERLSGELVMWRVGRAYAALKLREIDGLFGGELAGHYYFRDFYYSDSAFLACSILLGVFAKAKSAGEKVSEIIAAIKKFSNSGEINFVIARKEEAMEAVKNYFEETEKVTALYDFDGYRLEFGKWWFNIRPSNTEPYLRLIVEAETDQLLQEKLEKIEVILKDFK